MACDEIVKHFLTEEVEKLDLSNPCFSKHFLTAWRSGKTCCPACLTRDFGKICTFLPKGLSGHNRSSHRRSEFNEGTVKRGIELLQELVASETFSNLQTLSDMRRTNVSVFYVLQIFIIFFDGPNLN